MTGELPSIVDFGREICGDLAAGEAREWLATNGLGGFACGTVAGTLTRRYHGLLVAALPPPWHRRLLVSKVEEAVEYAGRVFPLGANRWAGGAIEPHGYVHLERFRLEGASPVWTYACADAQLEKRIWMEHGANTTYVQYRLLRASRPLKLSAKILVNFRDYHYLTRARQISLEVQSLPAGLVVKPAGEAPPFYLLASGGQTQAAHTWYENYELMEEQRRGLDHVEDHLHVGTLRFEMQGGEAVGLVASTQAPALVDIGQALKRHEDRQRRLLVQCTQAHPQAEAWPEWIRQLVLAADQFIVQRPIAGVDNATSIIAGYPWFGDWGRDTMIASPGLLLATGRPELAAGILRTYARCLDRGMLPNRLPEAGEPPEFNTVDAALWFFEAARQYYAATGDLTLIRDSFSPLEQIITEYTRGTRYNIHVDPADGLLYAGEPGVQLTWMDAKIGDWVVTARTGKAIDVNALWLNALAIQTEFAKKLGEPAAEYARLAHQAREGFKAFWNPDANCCFDVIDGPNGNDAALRPNQILAVALGQSPLTGEQEHAVVSACANELVTSFGLRSLSPRAAEYCGAYGGDVRDRDGSYHQGTGWVWLIGPFVQAVLRVTGDRAQARSYLLAFENHLRIHGLGSASEIFDGDPPFGPQGCFAQAWSVGEVLRAWKMTG